MLEVRNKMKAKIAAGGKETLLLGPNCPGLITPDEIKIGIMPGHIHKKGPHRRGFALRHPDLRGSRPQLTEIGLGQSSAVGIGGDPINGIKHIDVMRMFNDDPDTDAVIMIGEIGGPDEAEAAMWCKENMKKPIVGFIAGVTAPAGKRMGHAGALISGGADTADAKLAIMEECGFTVATRRKWPKLLKALLWRARVEQGRRNSGAFLFLRRLWRRTVPLRAGLVDNAGTVQPIGCIDIRLEREWIYPTLTTTC